MDIFQLSLLYSYSIALAAAIGLARFRSIDPAFQPFIYLCCIALMGELVSTWTAYRYGTNAPNANVYVLLESMLFLWFFYRLGAFAKRNIYLVILVAILICVWIFDNLIWHQLGTFNSLFRIVYAFVLIFLSIDQINQLLVREPRPLWRDPVFLIAIGVLVFYSYKATIEVFYLVQLELSNRFYNRVHLVLEIMNLIVNLVYALAILWMPKKRKFTLPL